MTPKIDTAILVALSLDAKTTTLTTHGGSCFASTYKLTSKAKEDGSEKLYFIKTGKGKDSEVMFAGEHTSLNAIHAAVSSLCPRSYAHGRLSSGSGSFLVTDFLDLSPRSSTSSHSSKGGTDASLAQKLAQLHSTPAAIPPGYDTPQFGFPVPTCCGDTVQDNSFKGSWAAFYGQNRLLHVLAMGERKHGIDASLHGLVERTVDVVVPRLLRDGHLRAPEGGSVKPVVVHGDLWSGNHGRGRIGDGEVEEVVFDAASSYAHSEFEFGIMRMFGGFGREFEREYRRFKERDEPVAEWDDRLELYELYHHLNHYCIFGRSYKGGAASIMERLLDKYSQDQI